MSRGVVILAGVLLGSVALACNGLVDEGQLYGGGGGPDDGGGTRSDASTGGNTPPPSLQAAVSDSSLEPANACSSAPPSSDAGCYASCCTPAGTIEPYTRVDQLYSSLLGKWQFCTGIENWQWLGAPTDAIGVEFAPSATPPPTDGGAVTELDITSIGYNNGGVLVPFY